jgi:ABC-type lipoprotein release transport system permease subunit
VQSAALKGVDPEQRILRLPTEHFTGGHDGIIPAMIGSHLAKQTKLQVGDYVTVRWRDVNGTFDADDILIVQVISTTVPSVDQGVIWIPIGNLQEMLQVPGEASLVVLRREIEALPRGDETWIYHDPDYLLSDIIEMIKMKSGSSYILYGLLLFMGLIAIFDTQILSIWRRRKEIGTLMALGMERLKVIGLFTIEGGLHGLLALGVGAVYGIPVLTLTYRKGIPLPSMMSDFGFAIPQTLYPAYGIRLVIATTLLVLITVTIVSYLPASKISKLKPTEALRGKGS